MRIALAAARAAKTFQPTCSREEANAALPDLVSNFGLSRTAAIARFDSAALARRELDWWQARRQAKAAGDCGKTITDVAALAYGKPTDIVAFGIARAEAMAYGDARGEAITDQAWARDAVAGRHCTISQDAVRFRRHIDPLRASLTLRHAVVDALASGEMDGRSPDRATL